LEIHVGSQNQIKVDAVTSTIQLYPKLFPNPEVAGIEIKNQEFEHPKNINQTVSGAINRAKNSFQNCIYSFGIEGGLIKVPHSVSGFMETTVCAIYDGSKIYLGFGPCFEWPIEVTKLIISGKADASLAFKILGLTQKMKLGAEIGGINGFLTNGRSTREDSIKQSIIMALIYLERAELR
jgi:inosine/xanthosine triphosphatase